MGVAEWRYYEEEEYEVLEVRDMEVQEAQEVQEVQEVHDQKVGQKKEAAEDHKDRNEEEAVLAATVAKVAKVMVAKVVIPMIPMVPMESANANKNAIISRPVRFLDQSRSDDDDKERERDHTRERDSKTSPPVGSIPRRLVHPRSPTAVTMATTTTTTRNRSNRTRTSRTSGARTLGRTPALSRGKACHRRIRGTRRAPNRIRTTRTIVPFVHGRSRPEISPRCHRRRRPTADHSSWRLVITRDHHHRTTTARRRTPTATPQTLPHAPESCSVLVIVHAIADPTRPSSTTHVNDPSPVRSCIPRMAATCLPSSMASTTAMGTATATAMATQVVGAPDGVLITSLRRRARTVGKRMSTCRWTTVDQRCGSYLQKMVSSARVLMGSYVLVFWRAFRCPGRRSGSGAGPFPGDTHHHHDRHRLDLVSSCGDVLITTCGRT
jgi:hypothetical protein